MLISFFKRNIWFFHHIVLLSKGPSDSSKEGQITFPLPYQHAQMLQSQVWGCFQRQVWGRQFCCVYKWNSFLPLGRLSSVNDDLLTSCPPGHFEVWTLTHSLVGSLSSGRWISVLMEQRAFCLLAWTQPSYTIDYWLQQNTHTAESDWACPVAPRLL